MSLTCANLWEANWFSYDSPKGTVLLKFSLSLFETKNILYWKYLILPLDFPATSDLLCGNDERSCKAAKSFRYLITSSEKYN